MSGTGAQGADTALTSSFDTQHEDLIHDAQLDYYGKRLATCSSDRTIKIYDIEFDPSPASQLAGAASGAGDSGAGGRIDDANGAKDSNSLQSTTATTNSSNKVTQHRLRETLRGHEGPVWQVCWANPKFGTVLASCSYDGRVIIWTELQGGQWKKVKQFDHQASVNSIAWGPHEYDLSLAAGLSDGKINVFTCLDDGTWDTKTINAHSIGCNSVSWAPAIIPGSLIELNAIQKYQEKENQSPSDHNGIPNVKRIVSGGCDNCIKIWKFVASNDSNDNENGGQQGNGKVNSGTQAVAGTTGSLVGITQGQWKEEHAMIDAHQNWVRDVAWAPSIGLPKQYIASCSQDKNVHIYVNSGITSEGANGGSSWNKIVLKSGGFPDAVWRVSWSTTGNILAVSSGDNKVTLWKEDLEGQWIQI